MGLLARTKQEIHARQLELSKRLTALETANHNQATNQQLGLSLSTSHHFEAALSLSLSLLIHHCAHVLGFEHWSATLFSHGAGTEFQPAFHICPVYHRSSSCLFAITVALPEAGNERKTWPYFVRSLFTHTLWESPVPNSIGSILPTAEDLKYSERNVLFVTPAPWVPSSHASRLT